MADPTKRPEMESDIIKLTAFISIIGKALVADGTLRKQDLFNEIEALLPVMDKMMQLELMQLRFTIDRWPAPTQQ